MTHIKVDEFDDWVRVKDGRTGKVLYEGHSIAPCHWADILSNYGVKIDIKFIEEDDDE